MLSLAASENKIQLFIEELLNLPLSQPPFMLTIHPGNLEDRAIAPIGVTNVVVRFKSIDFESKIATNPVASCFSQVNIVNWEIIVNNNNLRTHLDTYSVAMAIIKKLRGKKLLIAASGEIFAQSAAEVTKFDYLTFNENKACNKATIILSSRFTDTYSGEN